MPYHPRSTSSLLFYSMLILFPCSATILLLQRQLKMIKISESLALHGALCTTEYNLYPSIQWHVSVKFYFIYVHVHNGNICVYVQWLYLCMCNDYIYVYIQWYLCTCTMLSMYMYNGILARVKWYIQYTYI